MEYSMVIMQECVCEYVLVKYWNTYVCKYSSRELTKNKLGKPSWPGVRYTPRQKERLLNQPAET